VVMVILPEPVDEFTTPWILIVAGTVPAGGKAAAELVVLVMTLLGESTWLAPGATPVRVMVAARVLVWVEGVVAVGVERVIELGGVVALVVCWK
jgi:hypothetical protein